MSTQRERGIEAIQMSRSRAYHLLSHVYRRALVDSLDRREGGIALADAASDVAAMNLEASKEGPSPEAVEKIYAALYHSHVPTLVEADVVAHDRERNVVSLTARGRALAGMDLETATPSDGDAVGTKP